MAKKERKISIPNFDKSQFLQPSGALPTPQEVTQTVAAVTGKIEEPPVLITVPTPTPAPIIIETPTPEPPKQKGRPIKEASKERLPFNTMLNINISNTLKILAIKRRVSTADLIELAITRFLEAEGEDIL